MLSFAVWDQCYPGKRRDRDMIDPRRRAILNSLIREHHRGAARWPLLLHGPAGTGKTCVALCLLDYAKEHPETFSGWCPAYMVCSDWTAAVTQARLGKYEPVGCRGPIYEHELWEWYQNKRLVCIDEIGTRQTVSDTAYEVLKLSLDRREGRPLIVVSNLDLEGIARAYDDRIASRLSAGVRLKFTGDDLREKKHG